MSRGVGLHWLIFIAVDESERTSRLRLHQSFGDGSQLEEQPDGLATTHNGNSPTASVGTKCHFQGQNVPCLKLAPGSLGLSYNFSSTSGLFCLSQNVPGPLQPEYQGVLVPGITTDNPWGLDRAALGYDDKLSTLEGDITLYYQLLEDGMRRALGVARVPSKGQYL